MDKVIQAFKSTEITLPEHVKALSWNIATEPKLYWELASNPYSPRSLQLISERFPQFLTVDVIRAVVLAEPERSYDNNFRLLDAKQQAEALRNQRDFSSGVHNRLAQYYKHHEKEFNRIPKNIVYDTLSLIVFGTGDLKEIEQRYAQKQRRDLRLAIVNLVEVICTNGSSKKESVRRRPLLFVAVGVLVIILLTFLTQRQINSSMQQKASRRILSIETQGVSQWFPVRLKIPSINVDAAIEYVGITPNGEMEVPNNTANVGWFKLGALPGQKGSAVIAGHLDAVNGNSGVFAKLDKLKEGDKLYIEDGRGKTLTFVVRKSSIYDPGYADEVFSHNDGAHLNLVTCDGVWNRSNKSYSKRLVVFADISY